MLNMLRKLNDELSIPEMLLYLRIIKILRIKRIIPSKQEYNMHAIVFISCIQCLMTLFTYVLQSVSWHCLHMLYTVIYNICLHKLYTMFHDIVYICFTRCPLVYFYLCCTLCHITLFTYAEHSVSWHNLHILYTVFHNIFFHMLYIVSHDIVCIHNVKIVFYEIVNICCTQCFMTLTYIVL